MIILSLVAVLACVASSIFSLVCFAQGLFYIADVVEEHGQLAKKVLRVILYVEIGVHFLLLFDQDTSTMQAFIGLVAHLLYVALLQQFPFVNVKSSIAIASALAALINHFSWFFHVLLSETYIYTYGQIGGIFVILVWLCPLAFVVSLSSTEPLPINTASASSDLDADDSLGPDSRRKGHSLAVVFLNFLKSKSQSLLPTSLSGSSSSSSSSAAFSTIPEPSLPSSMEVQPPEGVRHTVQPTDYSAKFL